MRRARPRARAGLSAFARGASNQGRGPTGCSGCWSRLTAMSPRLRFHATISSPRRGPWFGCSRSRPGHNRTAGFPSSRRSMTPSPGMPSCTTTAACRCANARSRSASCFRDAGPAVVWPSRSTRRSETGSPCSEPISSRASSPGASHRAGSLAGAARGGASTSSAAAASCGSQPRVPATDRAPRRGTCAAATGRPPARYRWASRARRCLADALAARGTSPRRRAPARRVAPGVGAPLSCNVALRLVSPAACSKGSDALERGGEITCSRCGGLAVAPARARPGARVRARPRAPSAGSSAP